jgi:hypothetical protein
MEKLQDITQTEVVIEKTTEDTTHQLPTQKSDSDSDSESESESESDLDYIDIFETHHDIVRASRNALFIIDNHRAFRAYIYYYNETFYLKMEIDMFNSRGIRVCDEPTLYKLTKNKEIIFCGEDVNRNIYYIVNVKIVKELIQFLQIIVKILKIGHWAVNGQSFDLYKRDKKKFKNKTDEELESLIENFAKKFPDAPLYKQAKKK